MCARGGRGLGSQTQDTQWAASARGVAKKSVPREIPDARRLARPHCQPYVSRRRFSATALQSASIPSRISSHDTMARRVREAQGPPEEHSGPCSSCLQGSTRRRRRTRACVSARVLVRIGASVGNAFLWLSIHPSCTRAARRHSLGPRRRCLALLCAGRDSSKLRSASKESKRMEFVPRRA